MMSKRIYRTLQSLLLLLTLLVLGSTFYFQYIGGLQPCPLCLMQRFCALLLAMSCLMGLALSTLKRGRSVAIFQMAFAFAGLFFATRHIWLQSFPAGHSPVCLPGLDVLIHYFPWQDVLHSLLWGAGECAEVTWKWFGLSMPVWAGLYFLMMFVVSGVMYFLLGKSLVRLGNV